MSFLFGRKTKLPAVKPAKTITKTVEKEVTLPEKPKLEKTRAAPEVTESKDDREARIATLKKKRKGRSSTRVADQKLLDEDVPLGKKELLG